MTNIENLIDPDPKPYSPPNEVPGTSPDEVTPDQGDTDFPGSIPNETPMETPVTDPNSERKTKRAARMNRTALLDL